MIFINSFQGVFTLLAIRHCCLVNRRQESRAPIAGIHSAGSHHRDDAEIPEAQSFCVSSNSPFKPMESESVCYRHPMTLCDHRQEIQRGGSFDGLFSKYSHINENNIDTFNTPSVEIPYHGDPEPRY